MMAVVLSQRKEQPKSKKFDLQKCKVFRRRQSANKEKARRRIQGKAERQP